MAEEIKPPAAKKGVGNMALINAGSEKEPNWVPALILAERHKDEQAKDEKGEGVTEEKEVQVRQASGEIKQVKRRFPKFIKVPYFEVQIFNPAFHESQRKRDVKPSELRSI